MRAPSRGAIDRIYPTENERALPRILSVRQ